jgi:hypothetical protein
MVDLHKMSNPQREHTADWGFVAFLVVITAIAVIVPSILIYMQK